MQRSPQIRYMVQVRGLAAARRGEDACYFRTGTMARSLQEGADDARIAAAAALSIALRKRDRTGEKSK